MGAYSELDAALREDGDFVDDDAFAEDDGPCATPSGSTGNVLRVEPASVSAAQPVEPQPAAPAEVSDNAGKTAETVAETTNEDEKKKAHEKAEAERKAEFDARQAAKKAAEQEQLAQLEAMSPEELLAASLKRVGEDTEKLTRRHMMECVMEHIQTLCLSDPAFARKVMHPRKNMIRCCQYIGRKAWEYVQDELKAKGITPSRENPYGSAIPEGVCYQWAEDYFNDPDAKEDHEEEEKFVPKPYYGGTSKSKTVKKGKKDNKPKKPEEKKPQSKPTESSGQISLGDFIVPEEKAG